MHAKLEEDKVTYFSDEDLALANRIVDSQKKEEGSE